MYLGEFGLNMTDTPNVKVYTDDMKYFTDGKEELTNDDMEAYAVFLNSPWSQANEKYVIELNCKDAYTAMNESDPVFRCYYQVVGYEACLSTIYGYGNTEMEALENCMNNFKYIQEKYNPEDESF